MLCALRLRLVFVLLATVPCLSFATTTSATAPVNAQLDLFIYMQQNVHEPLDPATTGIEKYNRAQHFGGWVKQDPAHPCHNTRALVLERAEDHHVPIEFSANGCSVVTGLWHEPYTGDDVKDAADLQIDHVVPLHEAYYAGAANWDSAVRCHYANFLGNDFHLLAVSGHENMAKSDKAPDRYLPPSAGEHCAYLTAWMKIKAIWQLTVRQAEYDAIARQFNADHCADAAHYIDSRELTEQRQLAATPIAACENFFTGDLIF